MNRKKALVILSLVSFTALLGSAGLLVYGSDIGEDNGFSPERRSMRGFGHRLDLTDEQREALQTRVQEMRDAGASREEIRTEITTMLDGWGIDHPEWQGPSRPWMEALTDEQREALQTRVQEMRDAGASREEIRAEITTMLDGWGIDHPECQGPSHTGMGNGFRFRRQKKESV